MVGRIEIPQNTPEIRSNSESVKISSSFTNLRLALEKAKIDDLNLTAIAVSKLIGRAISF